MRTKCEDKRLRLVGRLLRDGAGATAVACVLAALQVEAVDGWLSTSGQLHRAIGDRASERNPQHREGVRRLRLALKLEEERIRLFDQSAAAILSCLGGRPRLILERVHEINNPPQEVDPDEARFQDMAVRVARYMLERCGADDMPRPEPLERKSQAVAIRGANLARTKCEDKRLRLVGRLLRNGADATAVACVLAALRVEALDGWLSTWRRLHREISVQVSERDPQHREGVRGLRLALKLAEERIRLFDQSAAGILRCLGGPPRLMLETINEINNAHRYEAKPPEERRLEMMAKVARIAIERCRAYSGLPVHEVFGGVLTEEELDLVRGRKPQAVEATGADLPANAKRVDSPVPPNAPQQSPHDIDQEKKGEEA